MRSRAAPLSAVSATYKLSDTWSFGSSAGTAAPASRITSASLARTCTRSSWPRLRWVLSTINASAAHAIDTDLSTAGIIQYRLCDHLPSIVHVDGMSSCRAKSDVLQLPIGFEKVVSYVARNLDGFEGPRHRKNGSVALSTFRASYRFQNTYRSSSSELSTAGTSTDVICGSLTCTCWDKR